VITVSDLSSLKKKIYEDGNVATILEALDCEKIGYEQGGKLITCQLPSKFGSDNPRSVQIKNDYGLSAHIRTRGIQGDIFNVVGYIMYNADTFEKVKENLYQIKVWVCNKLGYHDFLKNREKQNDYLYFLRDIKKYSGATVDQDGIRTENDTIDESILCQYFMYPHLKFYEEGLSTKTQREFEIGFDMHTDRIIFPVRNRNGQLIGIKGRYVGTDEETLEHKKYLYLYRCDKSIELYNLHRALPHIKNKGEVIVVEGAKTCMFLHQWGFKNCVSMEGKDLTPVQAMLLRELGVNIVFAWDKDCDAEFVAKQLSQLKSCLPTVIFDTKDLLEGHDSPVDKGYEVWYDLYTDCRYNQVQVIK
jgi:DNA primase